MNKYIRSILDSYEYPIINSFTFANGDMLVLQSHFIGEEYKIRVLCKSTISSYFDYNEADYVSSFSVPVQVENEKYSVFAGEGSWGGDGIIFVIDKIKNQPVWFLFLDNSNPFNKIIFEGSDVIIAHSSSNVKLKIPIDEPFKIESL